MLWQQEVDFLVIGSGAAGMTAAITAEAKGLTTLVVEKSATYGGTSALSGGVLWLPNHSMMAAAGIEDSESDAMRYLSQLVSADVPGVKLQAFVSQAGEMLDFMQRHSLLKYTPAKKYPDYYAELSGGKKGARSLDPVPYSRRQLGRVLSGQMCSSEVRNKSFSMTAHEAHVIFSFTWHAHGGR